VEVEFYCKDAREVFLSPKSVDLFLIHPPYFKMINDNRYGGDINLQINNIDDMEEFSQSLVKYINNMADALKDDGSMLIIVPNSYAGVLTVSDITKKTGLFIEKIIVWNFEKTIADIKNQNLVNFILHIKKDLRVESKGKGLDSLVIDQQWVIHDALEYSHLGFMNDGFPKEISDILIEAFSNEGDTVADVFGGTGTVILSALEKNRKAIYNDASINQFNLAKRRVYDTIGYNDNERQENMTKDEVVNVMLKSINDDNRKLCKQGGMSDAETEAQIGQSQQSLVLICSNLYDKLKDDQIIA
jgi:DNA modification methylase